MVVHTTLQEVKTGNLDRVHCPQENGYFEDTYCNIYRINYNSKQ